MPGNTEWSGMKVQYAAHPVCKSLEQGVCEDEA